MKQLLLVFAAFIVSLITTYTVMFWGKVLPNTYLPSGISLSGMDKSQLHNTLDNYQTKENVMLTINGTDYGTSFNSLGLTLDHSALDTELFTNTNLKEFWRLLKGLPSVFASRTISPSFHIAKESVFFPQEQGKISRLVYDTSSGRFTYVPPRYDYQIPSVSLLPQVQKVFGAETPTLSGEGEVVDHREPTLSDLNIRLANAASKFLVLRVKDGKNYADIQLSSDEIRRMLAFSLRGDEPVVDVDRSIFNSVVMGKLSDSQKKEFQMDAAYPNVVATLTERFRLNDVDPVILGIDDGPTSQGDLADKYVEVDLSQQKMYFFRDGKLVRDFRVSTGYDYPTPVGSFHIINKAPRAFSNIYSVWMDYWMGFKYANDIGAYLGIHEIAYSLDGKKRVYRLGNYIGEPKTGGCIALSPGEAKELYDMSEPGMLVRVVE